MINNSFNDIALQLIKSSAFCPMCSSENNENRNQSISAQMLDKNDSNATFYLKCSNCGASMISIISTNEAMGMGNGILFMTDLNPQEILNFKTKQPINISDLKEIKYLIYNK